MPARKPVYVRQLDAARQAQIAVVCAVLTELGFVVPEAIDIDPNIMAECVIKGVDVNGVITEIDEAHAAVAEATSKLPDAQSHGKAEPKVEADIPTCPKCSGEMAVRTVKNGPRAGSQFYGCMDYPACKGTRSIES